MWQNAMLHNETQSKFDQFLLTDPQKYCAGFIPGKNYSYLMPIYIRFFFKCFILRVLLSLKRVLIWIKSQGNFVKSQGTLFFDVGGNLDLIKKY